MKKLINAILALALAASLFTLPAAAAGNINVTVNGTPVVWSDATPFSDENNRVLVPLRAVADAMGLEVSWNQEYQRATFIARYTPETSPDYNDGDEYFLSAIAVQFWAGTNEYFYYHLESHINDTDYATFPLEGNEGSVWYPQGFDGNYEMDTNTVAKDGRIYAPIRYLAELLGYDVAWNQATSTVEISDAVAYSYWYKLTDTPDASWVAVADIENAVSAKIVKVEVFTGEYNDVYDPEYDEYYPEQVYREVTFTPFDADFTAKVNEANDTNVSSGILFTYDEYTEDLQWALHLTVEFTKDSGCVITDHLYIYKPWSWSGF